MVKTVGLFDEDARIYYVDHDFVVINNLYNGDRPIIIMRHLGTPSPERIEYILKEVNMKIVGKPFTRDDGLWTCEVVEKEVNYGAKM